MSEHSSYISEHISMYIIKFRYIHKYIYIYIYYLGTYVPSDISWPYCVNDTRTFSPYCQVLLAIGREN